MAYEEDTLCKDLPNCSRPGCGQPACPHGSDEPHVIAGSCAGYVYPANWICQSCGEPSTKHEDVEPYPGMTSNCEAFAHVTGQTAATFIGGGGRYGGGGATGSW